MNRGLCYARLAAYAFSAVAALSLTRCQDDAPFEDPQRVEPFL